MTSFTCRHAVAVETPNPRGDLGERLSLTQVDQHQQCLAARVQLAPGRSDRGSKPADHPGEVGEGRARQRQRSTIEKHLKPLGSENRSWSIDSPTRGFTTFCPGHATRDQAVTSSTA
jgi:hypothetical protein